MSVIINLDHGLGNKLFKLVHALIAAERMNKKLYIYNSVSKHEKEKEYPIYDVFTKLKDRVEIIDEITYEKMIDDAGTFRDEEIVYTKKEVPKDILLKGYFMIKYYLQNNEWRKWIRNILKFNIPSDIQKPSLGIHIRVGDYLKYEHREKYFPLYHPDYYKEIIKKYPEHNLYFFTDTGQNFIQKYILEYVKNNAYIVSTDNPLTDMLTMSKCDILILSSSTFSYWAAYLSDAKVYCPNYFLMRKLKLPEWTIIDTDKYKLSNYDYYR